MIRQTKQRIAIEQVFKLEGRPLTPAEVYAGAQQDLPGIGVRTVYRQIRDMAEQGLIVGIDYPGQPVRYEWVRAGHHSHFICRKCNQVYDLQVESPDVKIDVPEGFTVSGQETIFYGTCPKCQNT